MCIVYFINAHILKSVKYAIPVTIPLLVLHESVSLINGMWKIHEPNEIRNE